MIRPKAIDLFAGAGGATEGLRNAGYRVVGAVEIEADAAASYRANHQTVRMWQSDIRKVAASAMRRDLGLAVGELALLKACPPCQGFSSLAEGRADIDEVRNDLVGVVTRFVREFRPRAVLVENVPGLGRDARAAKLMSDLQKLGYASRSYVVNALDFGVPQRRRRFIIVALRGLGRAHLLPSDITEDGLDGAPATATVRTAFAELADIDTSADPLSTPRALAPLVEERLAAIPPGGNRFDLPDRLQLDCHRNLGPDSRSATASYGRMKWDEASPTMTTRCTTPACGSFVHPTLNRGITLREAALLQTFPATYRFVGGYGSVERQIGNAVPVRMASALGRRIRELDQLAP